VEQGTQQRLAIDESRRCGPRRSARSTNSKICD
jgi:hypothetical protein